MVSRRLVHAPKRVQAAGITDIGQTLGYGVDKKLFIVSQPQIGSRVAGQLRLASALGGEEAQGDQFPLPEIQPLAGIPVAETVLRQPPVDVTAFLLPGSSEIPHAFTKNIHLGLHPRLETGLPRRCGCPLQGQRYPLRSQRFIDGF